MSIQRFYKDEHGCLYEAEYEARFLAEEQKKAALLALIRGGADGQD